MIKNFTKAQFKAWLEDKHPRTKVGSAGDCYVCPLAKFVVHTIPVEGKVEVDRSSLTIYNGDDFKEYPLPQWARAFIDNVDQGRKTVTAKQALDILRECA